MMICNPEEDELVLSTGRLLYAYTGIVGIGPDGKAYYGYDGGLEEHVSGDSPLTPDERKEIALYQINLWKRYGNIP